MDNKLAETNVATLPGSVPESKKVGVSEINKRLMSYKLICANYNKGENKIGIGLLDYKSKLENGHYDVMPLECPVITAWLDINMVPGVLDLITTKFFNDVYCVVSGEGKFIKVHKVLSKSDYDKYMQLLD